MCQIASALPHRKLRGVSQISPHREFALERCIDGPARWTVRVEHHDRSGGNKAVATGNLSRGDGSIHNRTADRGVDGGVDGFAGEEELAVDGDLHVGSNRIPGISGLKSRRDLGGKQAVGDLDGNLRAGPVDRGAILARDPEEHLLGPAGRQPLLFERALIVNRGRDGPKDLTRAYETKRQDHEQSFHI